MKSVILNTSAKLLLPWLLAASVFILYRGHNLPGGGFIGGLAGACGFILYSLSFGVETAKRALRFHPETLMGTGLTIAIISGALSWLVGKPFLSGLWLPSFSLPLLGKVHIGTPLLFDIGVYITVIGFVLITTFNLADIKE